MVQQLDDLGIVVAVSDDLCIETSLEISLID